MPRGTYARGEPCWTSAKRYVEDLLALLETAAVIRTPSVREDLITFLTAPETALLCEELAAQSGENAGPMTGPMRGPSSRGGSYLRRSLLVTRLPPCDEQPGPGARSSHRPLRPASSPHGT